MVHELLLGVHRPQAYTGRWIQLSTVLNPHVPAMSAGSIEALGATPLMAAPPPPRSGPGSAAPPCPSALLPPTAAADFLHPDCVAMLAEHLKVRQEVLG